MAFKGKN